MTRVRVLWVGCMAAALFVGCSDDSGSRRARDAGVGGSDAGQVADAGALDASTTLPDAGPLPAVDSGGFPYDVGGFSYDAGTFPYDTGGFSFDAGSFDFDASIPSCDDDGDCPGGKCCAIGGFIMVCIPGASCP